MSSNDKPTVVYANIMDEIKARVAAINIALSPAYPLAAPFVREFCYLQIRLICECVALGCLVAHGDITPKSLEKAWSADEIMTKLTELHPDFFPQAVKQGVEGGKWVHIERVTPPVLSKEEFLKIYGKCGQVLHRGNLRKLLKPNMPIQHNFPEIAGITQKLQDLLSIHVVVLRGGDKVFIAVLSSKATTPPGGVQVATAERDPQKPPVPEDGDGPFFGPST